MSKKLPTKCPDCGSGLSDMHDRLVCNGNHCDLEFVKAGAGIAEDKAGWFNDGKRYRPFKQYHTSDLGYDADTEAYRFSSNFLRQQKGLFDFDYDNNEVRDRLEKAGVFTKKDKVDSEAGEVWVNFEDYEDAKDFLDRLNTYLRNRHAALQALRKQMRELP